MSSHAPAKHLAIKINEAHRSAVEAAQSALLSAREAGLLLLKAKETVPHGQWGSWLEKNVEFSTRTAQGYMRVATGWEELSRAQRVADLSLRGALALLSTPKEEEFGPEGAPSWLPGPDHLAIGRIENEDGPYAAAWIVPYAEDPEFFYYTLVERVNPEDSENTGACVGGVKPVRGEWLTRFLNPEFPHEAAEWSTYPLSGLGHLWGSDGWTYNKLLFRSHDQYMQEHVLGRTLPRMEEAITNRVDELDVVKSALREIRTHQLYRETHETFEGYVADRWPDLGPTMVEFFEEEVAS